MASHRPLIRLQGKVARLPAGDWLAGLGSSVTAIAANTTITSAVHGNHPVIQVTAAGVQVTIGADFDVGTHVTVLPQTATTHSGTVLPGTNTITSLKGTTLKTLYAQNQAVVVQCVDAGLWIARSVKAANAAAITLPYTLTDDDDDMLLSVSATGDLTVPAGLRASFSCVVNVGIGTTSVLSSGGTLLNGAALTATRVSSLNPTFAIIQLPGANTFRVTGF